jgi:hypothetical protein
VALWVVARPCAWITSQRETTSRAVNCLNTTGDGAYLQGIDLHEVAGLGNRILLGFAHRIGTQAQGPPRSRHRRSESFGQLPALFQPGKNAAHHGSGDRLSGLPERRANRK